MATQVQFRRGTTTQNNAFTGAVGEITYDTDVKTLRLHDGTNSGGGAIVATLDATQTMQNKTLSTNSAWQGDPVGIAYGGTGNSITVAEGAVAYGTDTGISLSLAGTSGQILSSGGTSAPTWINASSLTVGTATTSTRTENIDGGSAGYLVYQVDTNDTGFIAPGNTGYVLQSTGASTAPSWVTSDLTIGSTAVTLGTTETDFTGINTFDITGTTTSTSTTTGALTVAGGISTQENLNVGGDLAVTGNSTFTGTVTFNGGTITLGDAASDNVSFGADVNSDIIPNTDDAYDLGSTTQEWKDLFIDGTAHIDTLDVDENATVAGTLDVTGATTLTDDLAVNGGDLTTTATTFNLLETNATTVNAFGAATTIDIGATTGTMTINNNQVVFNTTDSIQIPVGTTAQRDGTPVAGQIRYNSTISSFEGYGPGNAWGSLGGVKDVDQDTYLLTEASAGSDEDTFEFYNATVNTLSLSGTAFDLKSPVTMTVNNTTDASSSTTGAVIIDGGVGIAKKLYVGTDADVGGNAQIDGTATVTGLLTANGGITADGGVFTVADTTGNVHTSGTLDVDGNTNLDGNLVVDGTSTQTGNVSMGGTLGVTGATTLSSTLDVTGLTNFNNTTECTNLTTASVVFDGGVAVTKKLHVGGNTEVDGNLVIDGNFTVNGTTTTIDATNLSIEDNLIYLNQGSTITNPDLGFAGNYNDGTYAHAGIFRDATDGGTFKIFDSYTPEPGTAIDTSHASYNHADLQIGGLTVDDNATVGGTLGVTSTLSAATGSTIGNLTLANGSITDSSGAISFGNENLSTTGTLSVGAITGSSLNLSTGAVTAGSLDISGNADIDGTMEADAYTVNGTALNEYIADTVGAMVTSNTESGISVTYDDADNTLDFNVNDPTITLTGAVTGSATMTNLGNVSIATTATADPTLTIDGDASGTATFTNLGNATLTLTIADDSHNHVTSNIDGLAEYIADTVGAMVTSNTESGLSVTYDDADNTLDFSLTNDPVITLTGDVTGSATMTNLGNVSISTTVAANSVALGTDTTGNYMANVSAGGGISVSHTQGEGSTATVSHADTSSQASVNNSGSTFIQDITLDTYGHITGIASATVPTPTASSLGLGTTNDVRFDSLGIGTAASGTTGEIRATNQITSYYSDNRLKDFEGKIENALDKVLSLNGYYYKANARANEIGYITEERQVGVSAQEVEAVLPEIIAPAPINDVIPRDQERDYKTVHYEKLVPLLIEAMKEQQKQIDELKKKLGE